VFGDAKDFYNTILSKADHSSVEFRCLKSAQQETFAKQHATARSSAAPPSLSGHGFDFLNSFPATG
jgi:hypothetical protein